MKVKISWRKCVTHSFSEEIKLYMDHENCPLGQTLKEMGVPFLYVGGTHVMCGEEDNPESLRVYPFDVNQWNPQKMRTAGKGHRSVVLEIPGLEHEGRYGCND